MKENTSISKTIKATSHAEKAKLKNLEEV